MSEPCSECGAPLADGGTCIQQFHSMRLLEHEVSADPVATGSDRGKIAHFYAVSSYVLQPPKSMNYTAEALGDLRPTVAERLAGKVTVAAMRTRVCRARMGRPGFFADPTLWYRDRWSLHGRDSCGCD